MKIEFMPWYQPGSPLLRCGGDEGCGALLVEGDTELHTKFHERVDKPKFTWKPQPHRSAIEGATGGW